MSWLAKEWTYRMPLALVNSGGANTLDADFSIPNDLGPYWRNSLSNLNDIRVTAADGVTLLNWKQGSNTNYSNKIVEVEVDAYDFSGEAWGGNSGAATANSAVKGYLYWGNDTANLASGQAANVSIANAITPGMQLAQPTTSTPVIRCRPLRKDQLYPDDYIVKQSTESTLLWWDLKACMMYRSSQNERSRLLEEIAWARIKVEQIDGNNIIDRTSTMTPPASISFSNHHIVSHTLTAGASGGLYLITLTVGTDDGMGGTRVLDYRCTLKCYDLTANTT